MTGGGGRAASASYAAQVTWGQAAIGRTQCIYYDAGMGFWHGTKSAWRVRLPWVGK